MIYLGRRGRLPREWKGYETGLRNVLEDKARVDGRARVEISGGEVGTH